MSDFVFVAICAVIGALAGWSLRPVAATYDATITK